MRKIVFILCLSFLSACYDSELDTGSLIETNNATTDNTIGNPINLKLTYDIVGEIDNESNYLKLPTGCSRLDECLNKIGATGIERIFPNAGKYERYQKEYGLNQWYSFVINKDALSSRAIYEVFGDIAIFIEPIRKMYLNDYKVQEFESDVSRSVYQYPFNDPLWRFQWNMKNDGLLGESGKDTKRDFADGADINIVPAWRETTGDSRVVVSIVDGGIDIIHEDLKENLWINNGEIPGNGIDDDNNGYIDDVHGYNFVDRNGEIIPHEHGTHVAGVIAAVNNNGKGISGIAGGNGFKDSGAKIMSCQIFKPNPDYDPSDPHSSPNISVQDDKTIAEAIVYGANNGALISQNSWGYNDFLPEPKVITEAIDYFNNIAGMYEGSLMKGGICIFSAGNDGVDKKAYPAARSQVVAVSSFAPDYAATWYTNYGYWVDLCAPGGSSPFDGKYSYIDGKPIAEILSTLPSKNGKGLYGYMQGTSMACPHVSGIAALIISKYGKDGFTNEELRNRLLSGIKAIDINKYNSVNYKDKLGVGFVDATVALKDYDENSIPPLPVFIQSKSEVGYDFIKIFWTSDESGDDLFKYRLYYSSQIISSDNYLTEGVESFDISANCAPDGQEFTRTLEKLKTGTKYYFALQSIARNGKTSSLSIYEGGLSTLVNIPPSVTTDANLEHTFNVYGKDILNLMFKITDKDNHTWKYNITNPAIVYIEQKGDVLDVKIPSEKLSLGEHQFTLTVTDEYNASTSVVININKNYDSCPVLKNPDLIIALSKGDSHTVDLKEYIVDEDVETLNFKLGELKGNNVQLSLEKNFLTVEGKSLGQSKQNIIVTDKHGQSVEFSLPIFVYMNKGIFSLFPTEVEDILYVRLGTGITGEIILTIRNVIGKIALKQVSHTDELDSEKKTVLLDVSSLYPGKYSLSISNQGKIYTESFLKQ